MGSWNVCNMPLTTDAHGILELYHEMGMTLKQGTATAVLVIAM
jgi:hypothetical protein